MKELTLLTINWNTRDVLELCLKAFIYHNYSGDPIPLVLIDNGSTDNSVEWFKNNKIPFVSIPINTGHEQAINVAFQLIATRFALLIDPDTEIKTNIYPYIERLTDDVPVMTDYRKAELNWGLGGYLCARVVPWFFMFDIRILRKHNIDVFHRRPRESHLNETRWFDIGSYMLLRLEEAGLNYIRIDVPENCDTNEIFRHYGKVSADQTYRNMCISQMNKYKDVNLTDKFIFKKFF